MQTFKRLLGALLLGLVLTVASAWSERNGQMVQVGGEGFCGLEALSPCYVSTFGGGFPFVYLVNNPQISVPTSLSFIEDDFHAAPFAANVAFWTLSLLGAQAWCRRRAARAHAVDAPGVSPDVQARTPLADPL